MEGHLNMLISTLDTAQHCKIIGYGICAQEDETSHEHIVSCLQKEMECLVRQYSFNGHQI